MEHPAVVAELAYALDSGSSPGFRVGVQVPSTASVKKLATLVKLWVARLFIMNFQSIHMNTIPLPKYNPSIHTLRIFSYHLLAHKDVLLQNTSAQLLIRLMLP